MENLPRPGSDDKTAEESRPRTDTTGESDQASHVADSQYPQPLATAGGVTPTPTVAEIDARIAALKAEREDALARQAPVSVEEWTRLPWKNDGGHVRSATGAWVALAFGPERPMNDDVAWGRERRLIGDLLVHRVNTHADLLAACKEALDHLDGSPTEVNDAVAVLQEAIAKADLSAIAKAEGRS